jgi:hypothetical protein
MGFDSAFKGLIQLYRVNEKERLIFWELIVSLSEEILYERVCNSEWLPR